MSGNDHRMADRLDSYRAKRDFEETPEPAGEPGADEGAPRFVVQEHSARAMHWDLRLEHEGTLASWAIPKGIPTDPKRNGLAVRTEDHPLEYLEFHGEIPAGNYGAGTMRIFDRGTFELHKWRDKEVMVTFHGERVQRQVRALQDRRQELDDPPHGSARSIPTPSRLPEGIVPMLARAGDLPPDDGWAFEIKWDGVRAIAYAEGGRLQPAQPQPDEHHAALPGAARARPRARHPQRGARRRGRLLRGRPAVIPAPAAAHAPDERGPGAPALGQRARRLHDLRPAVARRALADGADLRAAARAAGRARAHRPDLADARRTTSATARRCSPPRARRTSRGSSPSGSTAPTSPAGAPRAGSRSRTSAPRTSSSAAGRHGDGGRAGRLGALVLGFYDGRRAALRGPGGLGLHRRRAQARAGPAGAARARGLAVHRRAAAQGHELRRSGAGRERRVQRSDRDRDAPPPRLQGPARRHRRGAMWRSPQD